MMVAEVRQEGRPLCKGPNNGQTNYYGSCGAWKTYMEEWLALVLAGPIWEQRKGGQGFITVDYLRCHKGRRRGVAFHSYICLSQPLSTIPPSPTSSTSSQSILHPTP